MNKMLYIIRGLPGSGKSTLAKTIADALGCAYHEADMYFTDAAGAYSFDSSQLYKAHHWRQTSVANKMAINQPVVVSNTFTTEKEMKPYLEMAKLFGYSVTVMVVENRHGNDSIHNVPSETLEKMRSRFSIKL